MPEKSPLQIFLDTHQQKGRKKVFLYPLMTIQLFHLFSTKLCSCYLLSPLSQTHIQLTLHSVMFYLNRSKIMPLFTATLLSSLSLLSSLIWITEKLYVDIPITVLPHLESDFNIVVEKFYENKLPNEYTLLTSKTSPTIIRYLCI